MLLRFQRSNVIENNSSTSDSDNENQETLKLLHNKNPIVRLYQIKKILRLTSKLQKKSTLDKNILKGVFIRKLKDFQEREKKEFQNLTLYERLTQQKQD
mmetsp:Transcript_26253/g.25420  ORF Transcript_26253/g.25420 Transcript_26253/m.25420 type:complete len:99 (+) Transcript_26253:493-789(+)